MALKQLSFDKEGKRDDSKRDSVEFPINNEIYYAYRPTTNSIALFYASQGTKSIAQKLAGADTFLAQNLEPAAYTLVMNGIEKDVIPFDVLIELVLEIISEFAENPTTSSTASSDSPRSSGRGSTGNSRRPASTRVSSPRRVSAD